MLIEYSYSLVDSYTIEKTFVERSALLNGEYINFWRRALYETESICRWLKIKSIAVVKVIMYI